MGCFLHDGVVAIKRMMLCWIAHISFSVLQRRVLVSNWMLYGRRGMNE